MKLILSWVFTVVILSLFNLSAEAGDCDKARMYVKQAIELGNNARTLIKEEELYKIAVEECPSFAEAHNNLADVFEKQKRFEEAIVEYKKAVEIEPRAPYPYFGLGDIYYKTKRPEQAIEWYENGLRYEPDDVIARKRLSQLKNVKANELMTAETIGKMFSSHRGVGGVVSITFGEGLIPFDFDSYDIREDAKLQLNEIGKALQELSVREPGTSTEEKGVVIEIIGHTDIRGTDEYNLNLSKMRAVSVVNYFLNNFNIPKESLLPTGNGKRSPLCAVDSSESCHAQNRRVEIIRKAQ